MKKNLTIVLVLSIGFLFWISCNRGAEEAEMQAVEIIKFSDLAFADVLAQARQQNKHVLVDFFSPT